MDVFREGDLVTLYEPTKRRKLVVKVSKNKKIHTRWGYIDSNDIIGKTPGSSVNTHLGKKLLIFKPLLYEKIEHSRCFTYATQIVRPRDWGLIISFADIYPGKRVLEIGTGSGAFTAVLSHLVSPGGRVYSYEIDQKRAQIAMENLRNINAPPVYEIKIRDATKDGIEETDIDVAFVDIPEPWLVVDKVHNALKPCGMLVCYVPTFNQVHKLLESMQGLFEDIRIVDHFYRELQANPTAVRPVLEGYVFSAFVVFGRKILQ
ncbi:MAG: tRNA (adenine-N1)-methyltransferase [Crenarchaeota archaeon]|nr:tRNA (adenine-N1)-methyltransferase [Thermoproteota archaeon]MCR8453441.1 tRNA (adenine-N1)-methyltransferase [Thermoproteota archaeon]MCR8454914.1 tRNA (adenine-N1)-methyltransferase [Thermoproteota archaeon]MCR8470505.1 tRNA (adenine-N1)-methyltransferase [Thermoproteota archaeon]MCR8471864.1 tRNA (adenine-N1)-methyltransferase [Thermoproteota archaeon]